MSRSIMYARNRSGTRLHNPERDENFLHIEDNSKSSLFKNAQKAWKLLQLYSVSTPENQFKREGAGADCFYDVNFKAYFIFLISVQ